MSTIQLPAEVAQQKCYSDGHAFRLPGSPAGSEVSTVESESPTAPAYLAGLESPQSMRCAMPEAYAQYQALLRYHAVQYVQEHRMSTPLTAAPQQEPVAQQPLLFCLPGGPGYPVPFVMPYSVPKLSPPASAETSPTSGFTSSPCPTPPLSARGERPGSLEKKKKKRARDMPAPRPHEVTILLRNLPRELAPTDVLAKLVDYRLVMDFLYVPIDFETTSNLGYAFVNLLAKAGSSLEADLARLFPDAGVFVQPARVQGAQANVKRFRNSSVMAVLPEDCKPMIFTRGVMQQFPAPTKKLPPIGPRFRQATID